MPTTLNEAPASIVDVFQSFIPGYRLIDGEDLKIQADLLFSATDGLQGGTSQQNAPPLTVYVSQVAAGATVTLPPAIPGRRMVVVNDSTSNLEVFGLNYNPISGMSDMVAAANSSVQAVMAVQNAGQAAEYFCFAPGLWKQLSGASGGTGPGGGVPEAPLTGVTYGRQSGSWQPVLNLTGGTMTGPLVLAGPPNLALPNSAVNLGYVNTLAIDEGIY